MIALLLRLAGLAGCLAAAALAAVLGWAGDNARSEAGPAVLSATGYSRALYHQLELTRAGEAASIADPAVAAVDLLHRAPLSDAPLALRGLAAAAEGNDAVADNVFAQAFARNPRNVPARLWLAHRALESGEIDRAVSIVSGLFAVSPQQGPAYVEALASVATLPGGVAGIEKQLEQAGDPPHWASAVVARINTLSPDIDQLVPLNRITPSTQQSFIARMIAERGVEAGFMAWLGFTDADASGEVAWPYDARFAGKPGPPPFNWRKHSDLIEFAQGGGLNVSYLGRGRPVLVEQLILLPPGAYRLETLLSGESSVDGGGLGWILECSPAAGELGRVVMRELSSMTSRASFNFTVPADGCPAQRLVLRGEPGEFPTRARAQIASVAITPAQGGPQPVAGEPEAGEP